MNKQYLKEHSSGNRKNYCNTRWSIMHWMLIRIINLLRNLVSQMST